MSARRLIHSVDSLSVKAEKYVEHGTAISKLLPEELVKLLRKVANECHKE